MWLRPYESGLDGVPWLWMVVAFGVHGASKEKWKTENEEKITIFFTKKDFFFWNDLIERT